MTRRNDEDGSEHGCVAGETGAEARIEQRC
jgi:hypothetical protein